MAVPYTFGTATSSIPLSQLDSNFATAITLGSTNVYLGNTTTTLAGFANLSSTLITSPTHNSGTTLSLQTGGTTGLYIDASQNVGIGTTSPSSYGKLSVIGSSGLRSASFGTATNPQAASFYSADAGETDLILGTTGGNNTIAQVVTQLNIPMAFLVNNTERMRIDSSGNLLVGTTSAGSGKFRVANASNTYTGGGACIINVAGNYWNILPATTNDLYFGYNTVDKSYIMASTGAYVAVSDQTLKKNIIDISYGLETIKSLRAVEYNMLEESDDTQKHLGFIAQEAQQILPSSVSKMQGGKLGMDKTEIIPVLVKAIQELKAEFDAYKASHP